LVYLKAGKKEHSKAVAMANHAVDAKAGKLVPWMAESMAAAKAVGWVVPMVVW
jgi:hypothetical protein